MVVSVVMNFFSILLLYLSLLALTLFNENFMNYLYQSKLNIWYILCNKLAGTCLPFFFCLFMNVVLLNIYFTFFIWYHILRLGKLIFCLSFLFFLTYVFILEVILLDQTVFFWLEIKRNKYDMVCCMYNFLKTQK